MSDHLLKRPVSPPPARLLALVVACALATSSCASKHYAEKADKVVKVPDAYKQVQMTGEPLQQWCTDFGAPELEGLVDQAFRQNLDLRAAWARMEQAQAIARQQRAPLFPWLNAQASVNRQKIDFGSRFGGSLGGGQPGAPAPSTSSTFTTWDGALAASYEVDVWGKLRDRWKAAKLDAQAAHAQAESLAITLTSQIAENWLNVVYERARIALLQDQLEVSKKYLELVLLRLSQGQATALDVTQQKQNIEALRGQIALAKGAEATASDQIAVLVGKPPQTDLNLQRTQLPKLAPLPNPGVPADLITRRPDVRAAMLRVKAADKRTEAAVAERLPDLQLSANLSVQANEIAKLFDQLLWSASASLSQPIFQGGRLTAQIDQAEATAKEALLSYAQALLTAMREVQDALINEKQQAAFVDSLQKQVNSAERALELARERYRQGDLDYLRVLATIQSLEQTQQSLLDARRQRLSTRVSLCRALGGTWTEKLEPPKGDL